MQRPCFSLTVLLGSFALALMIVSSARCQTGMPLADVAVGATLSWKWLAATHEQDTYVHCANLYRTIIDSSAVGTGSTGISGSESYTQLIGTGYDAAYDFAMFDGEYYGVSRSATDIEETIAGQEVPFFVVSGPATSVYYDDFDCCLDEGYHSRPNDAPRAGEELRGWDVVTGDGEVGGLVEASASSCEQHLSAEDAQRALAKLQVALDRTIEFGKTIWSSTWAPVTHHYVASYRSEVVFDVLFDEEHRRFESISATYTYHEEAALIQAAATLDQLSLRLQEAAQQLRYIAADRIVSKVEVRRLAQLEE